MRYFLIEDHHNNRTHLLVGMCEKRVRNIAMAHDIWCDVVTELLPDTFCEDGIILSVV